MKKLIVLAIAIFTIGAVFNNMGDKQPKKLDDTKEIGQINTDIRPHYEFGSLVVPDTHGALRD
jgi:hypothetical protein